MNTNKIIDESPMSVSSSTSHEGRCLVRRVGKEETAVKRLIRLCLTGDWI